MGTILSTNISEAKGTVKVPVDKIRIDSHGVVGDAHAGSWHRQVSLLSRECIDRFGLEAGRSFSPGEFAENLTTEGVDLEACCIGDELLIGDVKLEVAQIGKECHGDGCAIFQSVGRCVMPKAGIFARVIEGGTVKAGDGLLHETHPLRASVITLSDRAASGEYEDRSGPEIVALLAEHFAASKRRVEVGTEVLPDDAAALEASLRRKVEAGARILITTGGTGIGPRDITPDVVKPLLDREIPGIMEMIRVKYGATIPSALLSRSVAGVMDEALVFTLPGSPKAVREYMAEILKPLNHALDMLKGLDTH
ncbi:MAG: molybdenum cofactor synthesis domain-containing protein [Planctomycetota bacterium]|jgi:molybdenum cofactor synthesis domain-containing protein